MKRLRRLVAAVRLGYAVATAPDGPSALCRLVGIEPSSTTTLTVTGEGGSRVLRYRAEGFAA